MSGRTLSTTKDRHSRIEILNPATDGAWRDFVDATRSDVFHSPEWMRVLRDTYQFKPQALVSLDHRGRPEAGLPFCVLDDVRGRRIVTMPFSDYCDPLVEDRHEWNGLVAQLLAEECPIRLRCLHNQIPLDDSRFQVTDRARWHSVDLNPELDAIWGSLDASARRAIRKAQKEGVTVKKAQDAADLESFFDLHLRVRKSKYRLLAQPFRLFERIWKEFVEPGLGTLLLAMHEDRVIGGVLFLEWDGTLYYKFNASSPASIHYRPNDLVMWEGIRHAKTRRCTELDLGLTDWDQEGLVRYKRKYASREQTISFLTYSPGRESSAQATHVAQLLPRLTDLLTDESVPDDITRKSGDLLYRYFA